MFRLGSCLSSTHGFGSCVVQGFEGFDGVGFGFGGFGGFMVSSSWAVAGGLRLLRFGSLHGSVLGLEVVRCMVRAILAATHA
jgi:hypothetical protein